MRADNNDNSTIGTALCQHGAAWKQTGLFDKEHRAGLRFECFVDSTDHCGHTVG